MADPRPPVAGPLYTPCRRARLTGSSGTGAARHGPSTRPHRRLVRGTHLKDEV